AQGATGAGGGLVTGGGHVRKRGRAGDHDGRRTAEGVAAGGAGVGDGAVARERNVAPGDAGVVGVDGAAEATAAGGDARPARGHVAAEVNVRQLAVVPIPTLQAAAGAGAADAPERAGAVGAHGAILLERHVAQVERAGRGLLGGGVDPHAAAVGVDRVQLAGK